jgi:hypothetical protein
MRRLPYRRPLHVVLSVLIWSVLLLVAQPARDPRAPGRAPAGLVLGLAEASVSPETTCLGSETTIFGDATTPANPHFDDRPVTLGVKFRSDVDGFVTGVRFYKDALDTGAHVGELWSGSGTLLASAMFSETASGWQRVTFSSPVAITANTTYIAANHTASGYPQDLDSFSASGVDAPPLHALKDGVDGGNGVYSYDVTAGTSVFPTSSFRGSNYYIDVVFASGTNCDDGNPCTDDSCDPLTGCVHTNKPDGTACSDGNVCTVGDSCVAGSCVGGAASSGPRTIFSASTTPANPHFDDQPVTLGVKFRSDIDGFVTGVRFYKDPLAVGMHIGELWNRSGTLLSSATFTETASGWQQVDFTTPVPISANTTYIAAYHTASGYPQDLNSFSASGVDNAPLHALQDGLDGGNGVYKYDPPAGGSVFPDQSFSGSNYYVDVVFTGSLDCDDGNPCTSDTCDPLGGCTHTNKADGTACDDGNACTRSDTCQAGRCAGGDPVICGSLDQCQVGVCDPASGNCVDRPAADGTPCTDANACTTGDACLGGACQPGPGPRTGLSLFDPSTVPANPHFADQGVELGVKFQSDVDGQITGVRFYKDPADNGIHFGSLWSRDGALLASTMFAETASGWQQVTFPTPVAITANTTYIASYHTTTGYPQDVGFFTGAGVDVPPLHALRDGVDGGNGVYGYDPPRGPGGFPDQSTGGSNYYVDVVFNTGVCDDGDVCTTDSCDPTTGCMHGRATLLEVQGAITFQDNFTTVVWDPTPDASAFNTYRGTLPVNGLGTRPAASRYDHVCFEKGDALADGATRSTDLGVPTIGTAFYYLVSGRNDTCSPVLESGLGSDSAGNPIPNASPCP